MVPRKNTSYSCSSRHDRAVTWSNSSASGSLKSKQSPTRSSFASRSPDRVISPLSERLAEKNHDDAAPAARRPANRSHPHGIRRQPVGSGGGASARASGGGIRCHIG